MTKSPYHHPALRAALLEAAEEELREFGTLGFSLRRIAIRAGVSHAAPYRHFRDREELLSALVWETQEAFTTALRDAREHGAGISNERLFRIGEAYLEFARENPERLSLMFSEAGMSAMARYPVQKNPDEMARYDSFGVLETTVKECQADGILDPEGNSGALSILIWSIVHGLSVIEREGFLESLGRNRGLAPDTTRRLVMGAFNTLVARGARPKGK
jgi:AcrR family transcriptional regulator